MSNNVITSSDIQVKYEQLYKFLMQFLWEFRVVQSIANLELAIFKRFPDKDEMLNCLRQLKLEISHTYNDMAEDDEPEFRDAVDDAVVKVSDDAKDIIDSIVQKYQAKIRKKIDTDIFIDKCMCKNNGYYVIDKDMQFIMSKDNDGNVSVSIKSGNIYDIFNPCIEVARTNNNCYEYTVQDWIWKFRKAINHKWFTEQE